MSKLRQTIAKRLVAVKNETAMLTTFNEVDMKPIMDLRKEYKDAFAAQHGVGLGFITVIIGHVTFSFPFVLVAVRARLQGLDPALEEAARDLGATPWGAFRHVILPALRPAILAGGLMAFLLSWDELIVTYFTASAASATLPLKVFGMAKVGLNPVLNALSALFLLVTLAGVAFSAYLRRGAR